MKWYPSLGVFTLAIMVGANAADKVEVSNLTVTDTTSGKIHYIQGTAHNVSGAPLGFVALTFKLYDSEDNVVGNALAVGQGIGTNENYKFSTGTTLEFSRVELSSVDTQ